jgi:hypothetical protein
VKGAFHVDYMIEIKEFLPQVMGIGGGIRNVTQSQVAVNAQ